jgi:hypothetical protein
MAIIVKSDKNNQNPSKKTVGSRKHNFLVGFIGTNRTGKSSIAKKIAHKWRRNNPSGHIKAFDPQDNFSEIVDDVISNAGLSKNEFKEYMLDKMNELSLYSNEGSLLILDDYKLIHRSLQEEEWLSFLMNFRAKFNVDIIYITHNPKLVINYLTYFTTHYYIFFTNSKEGSFEEKIPNYQLTYNASKLINSYVRSTGRGEYPNFPHIVVDTESEILIPENIDESIMSEIMSNLLSKNKLIMPDED